MTAQVRTKDTRIRLRTCISVVDVEVGNRVPQRLGPALCVWVPLVSKYVFITWGLVIAVQVATSTHQLIDYREVHSR